MMQKLPSAHHRTTLSSYVFATKACIDNRKNLLNSNISFRCSHNMANFGPLTGFTSWLRYCSDVAHRRPTKFCTMFGRLMGWYTIYTLSGANFTLCSSLRVLRSPILTALLHGTPAAGVSQTLRYGKGMELRNFRRGRHLYSVGQPSR